MTNEGRTRDDENNRWRESKVAAIAMEAGADLTIRVSKVKNVLGKVGGLDEIADFQGALRGDELASDKQQFRGKLAGTL